MPEFTLSALLEARAAFMSGLPIAAETEELARHLGIAASFAAHAYENGPPGGGDVDALGGAFLTALTDPLSPDLDYLRKDPQAGAKARAEREGMAEAFHFSAGYEAGERGALPLIADYLRAPHMDAKREIDERARAWIDGNPDPWVAALSARAEKAEARVAELEAPEDGLGSDSIGKQAVGHLREMYRPAYDALGASGRVSLRNTVNARVAALTAQPVAQEPVAWDAMRELCQAAADVIAWFDLHRPDLSGPRIHRLRYALAATVTPAPETDWRADPASDDRWCAGNDYALTRLCAVLGVDPHTVDWDGSDGSMQEEGDALIWRILQAKDVTTPFREPYDLAHPATPAPVEAVPDQAPEATEACIEQTEIVIKALQAAAREIDPGFPGHRESVGFAIRLLRNLTQSFQDACRENDYLRSCATPALVEAGIRDDTDLRAVLRLRDGTIKSLMAQNDALRAQSAPVVPVTPPPASDNGEGS